MDINISDVSRISETKGFRKFNVVLDRMIGELFQEHLLNTSYKIFKNMIVRIKEWEECSVLEKVL